MGKGKEGGVELDDHGLGEYVPMGEGDTAELILEEAIDDRSHGDEAIAIAGREMRRQMIGKFDLNRKLSDSEQAALRKEIELRADKIRKELDEAGEKIAPSPIATPPPP